MGQDELRALVESHSQGVLATIKRDGRPQLSNVAYAIDGDSLVISVTDGRAKTANLRRDPRASMYVGQKDFRAYAVVEGTVEVMPVASDPGDATVDALVEYYRALRGDHDDWDDYRRAMVDDGRLIVRLPIERLYGMA